MTEENAETFITWQAPPPSLSVGPDDVAIWRVDLNIDPARFETLKSLLSPEERERAYRFVDIRARKRFIVSRGALRVVLGGCLNQPPRQVILSTTSEGKPILGSDDAIRFNVSHAGDLALIGVTRGREIGVDVEHLRKNFDPEALARRFFAPEEYQALRQFPEAEKHKAYFHYWTGKEAFVKAVGNGLRYPLREFALMPGKEAVRLRGPTGENTEVSPYRLRWLNPAPGYVGAVAVEGCPNPVFRFFTVLP